MTSLDSILKSYITLPTKICVVKAMVFPVVMYGCESWTIKQPSAAAANSLQLGPTLCDPHKRQPTRLPCPWDSPGKNTGVGCHFILQCMKVKEESQKVGLKLNIQKTKILASGPITSWQIYGETVETVSNFFWGGAPKSLQMVTAAMKLKDAYSLEGKL